MFRDMSWTLWYQKIYFDLLNFFLQFHVLSVLFIISLYVISVKGRSFRAGYRKEKVICVLYEGFSGHETIHWFNFDFAAFYFTCHSKENKYELN